MVCSSDTTLLLPRREPIEKGNATCRSRKSFHFFRGMHAANSTRFFNKPSRPNRSGRLSPNDISLKFEVWRSDQRFPPPVLSTVGQVSFFNKYPFQLPCFNLLKQLASVLIMPALKENGTRPHIRFDVLMRTAWVALCCFGTVEMPPVPASHCRAWR